MTGRRRSTWSKPVTTRAREAEDATILPRVRVEFISESSAIMFLNGSRLPLDLLAREEVSEMVGRLVAEQGRPVRVSIVEIDGTVFTDLVEPAEGRVQAPSIQSAPAVSGLFEVSGAGFVPGEEVSVAFVARRTTADAEGTASVLVGDDDTTFDPGDVLLFGRISGSLVVGGTAP